MITKAVIIDDEKYSLDQMEYLLSSDISLKVAGCFTEPLEALDKLALLKPQVLFLDINMPDLNGMELASRALEILPELIIVYMTAYDQYAIQAFELAAIDYLLKPVSHQRLKKTLDRIHDRLEYQALLKETTSKKSLSRKLSVKTLGSFEISWKNEEPLKWRTEKTKELFAFLLHNANKEISREVLLNVIFDNGDLNLSTHNLHNNIYYIKKTLRDYGISSDQIDIKGKYKLIINEELIELKALKDKITEAEKSNDLKKMEEAEKLYTGDYFEGMDWLWIDIERESMVNDYMNLCINLSEQYLKQNKFNEAEVILKKAFQRDSFIEEVSYLLIVLYLETKRVDLAIKHYRIYEKILKEDLGITPSAEIRNLINKIQNYKQVV